MTLCYEYYYIIILSYYAYSFHLHLSLLILLLISKSFHFLLLCHFYPSPFTQPVVLYLLIIITFLFLSSYHYLLNYLFFFNVLLFLYTLSLPPLILLLPCLGLSGPKNEPPPAVQEKVLSLIQAWADAFRHQPELSGVSQVGELRYYFVTPV